MNNPISFKGDVSSDNNRTIPAMKIIDKNPKAEKTNSSNSTEPMTILDKKPKSVKTNNSNSIEPMTILDKNPKSLKTNNSNSIEPMTILDKIPKSVKTNNSNFIEPMRNVDNNSTAIEASNNPNGCSDNKPTSKDGFINHTTLNRKTEDDLEKDSTYDASMTLVIPSPHLNINSHSGLYTRPTGSKLGEFLQKTQAFDIPGYNPVFENNPININPVNMDMLSSWNTNSIVPYMSASDKKPDIYKLIKAIINSCKVRNQAGSLYFFTEGRYRELSETESIIMIRILLGAIKIYDLPTSVHKEIYKQLLTNPQIYVKEGYINQQLVACNNCIINIVSKETFPNDGREFITSKIEASYNNLNLNTPVFDKFIYESACGNGNVAKRMWIALGSVLVQDVSQQQFFLCYGPPRSGKSVFLKVICKLISEGACCNGTISDLSKEFLGDVLKNARIYYHTDLPYEKIPNKAVSTLKALVSGDGSTINRKYKKMENFAGYIKFIFASNHKLILEKPDEGFERRLIVVPFLNKVNASEIDYNLLDKISIELDGIFTKAMHYYFEFQNNNYIFDPIDPAFDAANVIEYSKLKSEADAIDYGIGDFISCRIAIEEGASEHTSVLYEAYYSFCIENGFMPYDNEVNFSKAFGLILGIKTDKFRKTYINADGSSKSRSLRGFKGIKLI